MIRTPERVTIMFGIFRLNQRKVTVFSLLAVLMILGFCLMALRAGAPDCVQINGENYPLAAEDEKDVEAFLTACGYVPEGCVSDREITVPKHWNDVYTAYYELQLTQGFNLVPYKGHPARELVYASKDSDSYATVLISGGRIIAAHLSTMLYGDEMKPLIEQ